MQCFRFPHTAERTIEGIEAMHVMRKGQVKRLDGRDPAGQANVEIFTTFLASNQSLRGTPRCGSGAPVGQPSIALHRLACITVVAYKAARLPGPVLAYY